jgi:hypothetical protein
MINKKKSQFEMRMVALQKENLRLQRKIYTLEAKNTTLQNELLFRPAYEEPKPYRPVTAEEVNKYLQGLRTDGKEGGTNAAQGA